MSQRDGELLVANDKKYSSKCFVGNWPGEKLVEDVSLIGTLPLQILPLPLFAFHLLIMQ